MTELPRFKRLKIQSPERILVITTRRIGDALLTTPLLRSLRTAWPEASIDVLAYKNKNFMLHGNDDIDSIIEVEERPSFLQVIALISRIFRRYQLSVSTLAGDRPTFYGWLAAKKRVGLVPKRASFDRWKLAVNNGWAELDIVWTHTVEQNLMLARVLDIPLVHTVVPPKSPGAESGFRKHLNFNPDNTRFAVLHPVPMYQYKRWTKDGWLGLMDYLRNRGYRIVITGGPNEDERRFCRELSKHFPESTLDLSNVLSFTEISALLHKAQCFVGPDTAMTHLAAACGIPTLAIFGPTNPVRWGPWPKGYNEEHSPFDMYSSTPQIKRNVALLQPAYKDDCVPCLEEGCDRHRNSVSKCLLGLPASDVIKTLEILLNNQSG